MSRVPSLILPLSLIIIPAFSSFAQQKEVLKERRIEELAEKLASSEDVGTEGSLLLDDLIKYSGQPVNINQATEDELLRLSLLNYGQVRSILSYRKKYGKILTMNELAVLEGFNETLLLKIEPFILFDQEPDSLMRRKENQIHQSLLARVKTTFPKAAGYLYGKEKAPAFSGKPYSIFTRYRGAIGKRIEFGVTGENDAGEEFFHGSNKSGFDFLSGFVCLNGKGFIDKIVVGDFHLRFGQGINLWSGGGVSYSSDLSSLMRSGEGIRPYSSTDENQFFRGLAVRFDLNKVKISMFYSDRKKDANIETDSKGMNYITSFRSDGLHRTISELSDEKDIGERVLGVYGDFRFDRWRFGVLASFQRFELPVSKGVSPYKSKSFEGNINVNYGLDYQVILNQVFFFGEAGMTQNFKPAVVNGMLWKAHPRLSLSLLHRYYEPGFQSFNSGAYGEGSSGGNEKGFFTAFEFSPAARIKLSGQADLFYFPWLTYQTFSPSGGHNLEFQVEVSLRSDVFFYLHSKFMQKPQKISGLTGVPEQFDESTSKWRIHGEYNISEKIQMRSRIEYTSYQFNEKREQGFLIFQDLIFVPSTIVKCWWRIAYYKTDGYDSRIYAYENDLLYYFAIPEFHGTGVRSYLNLKWQPLKMLSIYCKAGYTLRSGETSLGSGNDATQGNHRWDTRCQVALKF